MALDNLTLAQAKEADGKDPVSGRFQTHRRIQETRATLDEVAGDTGYAGAAAISLATNPTATDTLTIGADVYEFQAAAADLAADGNIAVLIGGSAAATLANLIAAINGSADSAHASIFQTDSTTPALGRGTEDITALDAGSGILAIFPSVGQGAGVPAVGAAPSIALSDALTAAVSWDRANLSAAPGGAADSKVQRCVIRHAVSAGDITAGSIVFIIPFVVSRWSWSAMTSAGELVDGGDDAIAVATHGTYSSAGLALNGQAGDLAAGDVVIVTAYG